MHPSDVFDAFAFHAPECVPDYEELTAQPLTVTLSRPSAGVIRVGLNGDLDLVTVARAGQFLTASVYAVAAETVRKTAREPGGIPLPGQVICDLDGLESMAVCGLRMIVEISEYAAARDVELIVLGAHGSVRRLLDLVGLVGLEDHFVVAS